MGGKRVQHNGAVWRASTYQPILEPGKPPSLQPSDPIQMYRGWTTLQACFLVINLGSLLCVSIDQFMIAFFALCVKAVITFWTSLSSYSEAYRLRHFARLAAYLEPIPHIRSLPADCLPMEYDVVIMEESEDQLRAYFTGSVHFPVAPTAVPPRSRLESDIERLQQTSLPMSDKNGEGSIAEKDNISQRGMAMARRPPSVSLMSSKKSSKRK